MKIGSEEYGWSLNNILPIFHTSPLNLGHGIELANFMNNISCVSASSGRIGRGMIFPRGTSSATRQLGQKKISTVFGGLWNCEAGEM